MKKKSQRVPDFSTKRPVAKVPGAAAKLDTAPPAQAVPAVLPKPHATSGKSGRRGG